MNLFKSQFVKLNEFRSRIKEAEDDLYGELLQSEAQQAMSDVERIPMFSSQGDLLRFMKGI